MIKHFVCSLFTKNIFLIFYSSVLSLSGDMEDIPNAISPYRKKKVVGSGSCSALIKLLPGNKDVYMSHDTWDTYQSMLRMLKKYDFAFKPQGGNMISQISIYIPFFMTLINTVKFCYYNHSKLRPSSLLRPFVSVRLPNAFFNINRSH